MCCAAFSTEEDQATRSFSVFNLSWSFYQRQREANDYYQPVQPKLQKLYNNGSPQRVQHSQKYSEGSYVQVFRILSSEEGNRLAFRNRS